MRGPTIRARLTLWYGAVMLLAMVSQGLAVYWLVSRSSLSRVDEMLEFELREASERLAEGESAGALAAAPSAFHDVYLMRVVEIGGRVISESERLRDRELPAGPGRFANVEIEGVGLCRVISEPVRADGKEAILHIATPLDAWQAEMAELRRALLAILPAGLIAATAGGYWLASSSLSPIARMTGWARRVSAGNLKERLATGSPDDELGRLAATLNDMLDRIDRGFEMSRRFTADAAHELRTPVATIRAEAEVAMLSTRTADEYRAALGSVVDEAARLSRLADRLLTLCREDASEEAPREAVRLDSIAREAAADALDRANGVGLSLLIAAMPEMVVEGDADGLRRVMDNLLDNAVKYTEPGGEIEIRGRLEGDRAVVEVRDTGIGLSAESLPRVFDRFYRADPSRSRRTGGAGLGLSIAKAVVERCGGVIQAESWPGRGSLFRVSMPARGPGIH